MESVPVNVGHRSANPRRENEHDSTGHNPKRRSKRPKLPVVAVIVGLLVAAALIAFSILLVQRTSASAQIDGSKYQAVFFTNGQVYFGKLESLSGGYFKLNDIFYLQSSDSNSDNGSNPQKTDKNASNVQLIKLGSEIHGPTDEMVINRDQVLFFENLKPDSKVTDSIGKYNNNKK